MAKTIDERRARALSALKKPLASDRFITISYLLAWVAATAMLAVMFALFTGHTPIETTTAPPELHRWIAVAAGVLALCLAAVLNDQRRIDLSRLDAAHLGVLAQRCQEHPEIAAIVATWRRQLGEIRYADYARAKAAALELTVIEHDAREGEQRAAAYRHLDELNRPSTN